MQILSKKRYQFKNGYDVFITQGGMVIENAPDWIAKDDLYNTAVANGNIVEIASKGRAVTEQAVGPKEIAEEQPAEDQPAETRRANQKK